MKPGSANGLFDIIEMDLIADVEGIYRDDLLEMAGRKISAPTVDAVLVPHAYADHVDYISYFIPAPRHTALHGEHVPHDPPGDTGRPATLSERCSTLLPGPQGRSKGRKGADLFSIVQEIGANILFPIHTQNP